MPGISWGEVVRGREERSLVDGYANGGITRQMELYREAISKVPQAR